MGIFHTVDAISCVWPGSPAEIAPAARPDYRSGGRESGRFEGRPRLANPRVSVICVFLNAERFFAEAIDSVLAQAFDDYELLLVDDGSTDGSSAMARGLAARDPARIRYLEHPGHAHRGIARTRELGLSKARGEFIAFIDSDDVWRPGKLAEQVALLEAHPECGLLCGTVNYWSSWEGGSDRLVPTGPVLDTVSAAPDTLLNIYPLGPSAAPCPSDAMFRRSVYLALGGPDEEFAGAHELYEDQTFYAKLYLAYPVWFSSRCWLDYRQHDASCVARARNDGSYPDVRRFFLEWFEGYVAEQELHGKEAIERAIRRARWAADHPIAARFLRLSRRFARG